MSYIKSLKIATELFPDLNLQNATNKDFIRIEKLLKVEQKVNPDFKATAIQQFINSLKTQPDGVRFLFQNENLIHLLSHDFPKIKKESTVNLEGFDRNAIYSFMSEFLKEDFNESVYHYFTKEVYGPVTNMLAYKEILPDETLELIRRRTEGKIDYLLNIADKLINKSPAYKDSFFELCKKLADENVNKKVDLFWYLLTKYSAGVINDHGLVFFFKTLGKGLYWFTNTPKNIEQKIERKLVLRDFWFMTGILSFIFALFVGAIIYNLSNETAREEQQQERAKVQFTKSLRGYLTEFDPAQATNIKYVDTLLKSGDNPFPKESLKTSFGSQNFMRTAQFTNETDYDIIILSDDDFMTSFDMTPYRYLLKANDSIRAKYFTIIRVYIGKKLAVFNSNEQYIPPNYSRNRMAPRFLEPYKDAKAIIDKRITVQGDIQFIQEDDDILIQSDSYFSVDGVRSKNKRIKL